MSFVSLICLMTSFSLEAGLERATNTKVPAAAAECGEWKKFFEDAIEEITQREREILQYGIIGEAESAATLNDNRLRWRAPGSSYFLPHNNPPVSKFTACFLDEKLKKPNSSEEFRKVIQLVENCIASSTCMSAKEKEEIEGIVIANSGKLSAVVENLANPSHEERMKNTESLLDWLKNPKTPAEKRIKVLSYLKEVKASDHTTPPETVFRLGAIIQKYEKSLKPHQSDDSQKTQHQ